MAVMVLPSVFGLYVAWVSVEVEIHVHLQQGA